MPISSKLRLFGHLVVDVAVEPAFVGLGGGDDGVVCGVVVPGSVLVLGGVAAAYVAAGEAGAEVDPGVAHRDALLADVDLGGLIFAVLEVFAEGHGGSFRCPGQGLDHNITVRCNIEVDAGKAGAGMQVTVAGGIVGGDNAVCLVIVS